MVLMRAVREKKIKGNALDQQGFIAEDQKAQNSVESFYAAVDIGTTTLSVTVYNQKGKYIDGCAEDNAQRQLGNDVMMRLMHASEGRAEQLHILIRDQIYDHLSRLINKKMTLLKRISVVGNTAMCHLFLNIDTIGLRGAPFSPGYQGSYQLFGRDLGWSACPDLEIIVLPGIAAHVGADAAAVYLAEQLWQEDRIQLAVDLGTNAEILLNHRGQVWACSAAAGPAFEGKGISCGCRGGAGAVGGVKLNRVSGNILMDVIPDPVTGSVFAKGVCGSGLVDLIAALLETGLLQPDGYLLSEQEARNDGICETLAGRLEEKEGERRFFLFDPARDKMAGSGLEKSKPIYITQQDIRNFQLAKGAIQTGIAMLCRQNELNILQIEDCRIAGVFGSSLQINSAKVCGLLPDLPPDRIHFVGNSAGKGAAQVLFDMSQVTRLEKQVQEIRHVELAEQNSFSSLFMNNLELCPWSDIHDDRG